MSFWPVFEGYVRVTEAILEDDICFRHQVPYWKCWLDWYISRKVDAKVIQLGLFYAVYRKAVVVRNTPKIYRNARFRRTKRKREPDAVRFSTGYPPVNRRNQNGGQ